MTTAAPTAPSASDAPPTAPPSQAGARWRRARGPIAVVAVLVLLSFAVSLGARPERTGSLEPEASTPEGSRALVNILEERGSEVTVARDSASALDAASGDALVVLSSSHRLTRGELERLAGSGADVLAVQPTGPALRLLAPGVETAGRGDGVTPEPECRLPAARAAGSADAGGESYSGGTTGCYPVDGGDGLVVAERPDGAATTVLGDRAPLTNANLGQEGNAALMLNLVDGRDVVWFLPDVPVQSGQSTMWDLLPPSLRWSLVPLGAALLLLALWRGRRLGPLVTERLPVVVRAAETTEGRARLYAARRARDRAAAALRADAAERLRTAVGLAADTDADAVAAAVALRTGDDPVQVRRLLYGAPEDGVPADDTALAALADDLDRLERRLSPGA
ncbi:DUF4350 domain-containing protein [Nocardiopsis sp. RSe5-2]|uniref:DUF4350 domain-containing protein n=1 Tax=Nocardiopsis endophytica TaxID=3018445 RepID=A0ABT4TZW0_9ACTN|nr:DUF4350 domain-containing protein [Nocardiopsis endophytica]MDA2810238.1 DUF4350 domain-containing protein [Nocardiopsis endophytica]